MATDKEVLDCLLNAVKGRIRNLQFDNAVGIGLAPLPTSVPSDALDRKDLLAVCCRKIGEKVLADVIGTLSHRLAESRPDDTGVMVDLADLVACALLPDWSSVEFAFKHDLGHDRVQELPLGGDWRTVRRDIKLISKADLEGSLNELSLPSLRKLLSTVIDTARVRGISLPELIDTYGDEAELTGTSFGEKVRKLRESRGWSTTHLGSLLEIQQSAVSRYENGEADPKISTVKKFASAFGVSPHKLL